MDSKQRIEDTNLLAHLGGYATPADGPILRALYDIADAIREGHVKPTTPLHG